MAFDFYQKLSSGCQLMKLKLDGKAIEQQRIYFNELKKWSKKVNLIAKTTEDERILENHFLDSLAILDHLPEGSRLVDVGTGAGFPGLVCKVARPDIQLFLVEPRAKRVSFLNHIIRTLDLSGVSVHCSRIEEQVAYFNSESISHITSRAVADVVDFIKMTSGLGLQVRRVFLKGPKWKEELDKASAIMRDNSLKVEKVDEYTLPFSGAKRAIIVLEGKRVEL